MQAGLKNAHDCIAAFGQTDFTEDPKKFDVAMLVGHGEDDQIGPIGISGHKSAEIIPNARTIFYPGLPHGPAATHADRFNTDPLAFLCS